MKKIILLFLLASFTSNAFAQEPSKLEERKDCEVKPDVSFIETLRCHVSGQIMTGDGPPGSNTNFKRQGSDSSEAPLYVIDGVPSSTEIFKSIKSEDIASISVLKYSPKTSVLRCENRNPVIIVRTKKNLTKRELRKLKCKQKKDAKEQAKSLKIKEFYFN